MNELDTSTEWREQLRLRLEDLVDGFVVEGVEQQDVLDAVIAGVAGLREAHDRDPDPARASEDGPAVEDPANDWPAA